MSDIFGLKGDFWVILQTKGRIHLTGWLKTHERESRREMGSKFR